MRAVTLACALLAVTGDATAGEQVDVCADAAERAQTLRSQLRYGAAREQLLVCIRASCPRVVRDDCTRWLEDLTAARPTLTVVARDERGAELVDVRVLVDGVEVATRLDGRELLVDPGPRTLRVEAPGRIPAESTLVVRERHKGRVVELTLPSTEAAAPAQTQPRGRGVGALVYATAGVGLVATAAWASFGIAGILRHGSLASGCGATSSCDPGAVDAARGLLLASDVAAGVALVAAGLFAVELIVHNRRSAQSVASPSNVSGRWAFP